MLADSSAQIVDHPPAGQTSPSESPWANEVANQQRRSVRSRHEKSPESPQEAEEKAYKEWSQGVADNKLPFDQAFSLAQQYVTKYCDTDAFNNKPELKAVRDWLAAQEARPSIELCLRKNVDAQKVPTDNELGLGIADYLGFNQDEIALYATQKGLPLARAGEAFYKSNGPDGNRRLLEIAEHNPSCDVKIGELNSGAIASTKQWLADYRKRLNPNPIDSWDWAKERTLPEAIATHLLVPTAGAAGSLCETVGDMVQGFGLPLHVVYNRTFMDTLGQSLRDRGQSMDMTSLYTKDEMNDAVIALVNVYAHAAGSAAPLLVPGAVAGRVAAGAEVLDTLAVAADGTTAATATAQMPVKALTLASEFMGAATSGGQVYDAAMTVQCRRLAEDEMANKPHSQKDIEDRIAEMKAGHLDPKQFAALDRKALVAAAFAAPAGMVQAKWLNEMSMELGRGVPLGEMPESLILNVRNELTHGGLIGAGQTISNEASQVVAGAKTPGEAGDSLRDTLPTAVLSGAMVGGTLGAGKNVVQTETQGDLNRPTSRTESVIPPLQIVDETRPTTPERTDPTTPRPETQQQAKPEPGTNTPTAPEGSPPEQTAFNPRITQPYTPEQVPKPAVAMESPISSPETVQAVTDALSDQISNWQPLSSNFIPRGTEPYKTLITQAQRESMATLKVLFPKYGIPPEVLAADQNLVRNRIGNNTEDLALYDRFLQAQKTVRDVKAECAERFEKPRLRALEDAVNAQLPPGVAKVKFAAADLERNTGGIYNDANGTITLPKDLIAQPAEDTETLIANTGHELVHHEQTCLLMRQIADAIGIKGEGTNYQRRALQDSYEQQFGQRPTDEMVQRVLEARQADGDKPLTTDETLRANHLAKDWKEIPDIYSAQAHMRNQNTDFAKIDEYPSTYALIKAINDGQSPLGPTVSDLLPNQELNEMIWLQMKIARGEIAPDQWNEQRFRDDLQTAMQNRRANARNQLNTVVIRYHSLPYEREAWQATAIYTANAQQTLQPQ